ncbi:MAG TPA: hypothetical protein VMV10_14500 [Pirellulales bacterium]|nr:hypothetical protein [Pirellulales bacterium]
MHELLLRRFGAALLGEQNNVLRSLAQGFHGKEDELTPATVLSVLLVATGLFLGIWLLSRWATRKERSGSYRSSSGLFRALCRAHRLDRKQRWLLRRLARGRKLPQPAALFLRPDCFAPSTLGPEMQTDGEAVQALGKILFGESQAGRTS